MPRLAPVTNTRLPANRPVSLALSIEDYVTVGAFGFLQSGGVGADDFRMVSDASGSRVRAWLVASAGAVAVACYFTLASTTGQDIIYVAIGALSTLAMVWGVRTNHPAERLGWWLLILGNGASTIGDGIENIGYGMVLNRSVPVPSIADLFYLAAYPLMFVGLARICRPSGLKSSRESYADATIVGLAAMALSWHFLMRHDVHRAGLGVFGELVTLAYPVMDLGLLFILLRSMVFGSSRLTAHRILAAAFTCTLVADSAYDYMVQQGTYATGNIIDAGWLLNYVLMAVAALHPSAAEPVPVDAADPISRRRLPVLTLAGFVAPAIVLVSSLTGAPYDPSVLAGTSIIMFSLVALRMSWLFERIQDQHLRAEADAAALADALEARDRLESDLRHRALHDPLTGLANRTLLFERAGEALQREAGQTRLVALCVCDLDGFKTINDSLGHNSGDELLAVMGKRLESIVRRSDTVARLGGDEFAVLIDGVDSTRAAVDLVDRIVTALREPVEIAGRRIAVSVSVGLAFAGPLKSTEQLLSEADVAMYEAKAKGKSRYETFDSSMSARSVERLELANALSSSLERGDFHLVYQPYLSLRDGRLEGFEALARWVHPTRGLVPTEKFIRLAEETGFMTQLGRWVMETACQQGADWVAAGATDLVLAVNVSGRQLQDDSFVNDLTTTLALTGLPPANLLLEVTESSLLADGAETAEVLAQAKQVGARIALDDFGTGYSSLAYLRHLPLDVLKIDKTFIEPLAQERAPEVALVSAIIDFARVLGLATVAEGVEHEQQRLVLAHLGCTTAQGFLLGRPVDAPTAGRLIIERTAATLSRGGRS
jgi:diguanylate cyclase (GGDEF)-like protein